MGSAGDGAAGDLVAGAEAEGSEEAVEEEVWVEAAEEGEGFRGRIRSYKDEENVYSRYRGRRWTGRVDTVLRYIRPL